MTFNQYVDFIYTSNIEPRNRKTNNQSQTTWGYPELKRLYMNYYLMSEPISNRLTIKKIEPFLTLMEVNFQDYLLQLLPATTILECQGTTYRNTVFHRQRFVYKEGINDGSEFKKPLPPELKDKLNPIELSSKVNDYINPCLKPVVINASINQNINNNLNAFKITASINETKIDSQINSWGASAEIQSGISKTTIVL
jgi:hypothetical protein